MENPDITNVKLLITIGVLTTLFLATSIILFVVYYQRKILLKQTEIKLLEKEKQIDLFKASVEAEEQQKEKIARNLHDEINPLLAVLKLNLSKHRIQVQKNNFNVESLKTDADIIDKVIEGIRSTCTDLIPSFLFEFGVLKSIQEYIRNLQNALPFAAEFENTTDEKDVDAFDKQAQLAIYRVCLELLNNIFKHSNCTQFKMITKTHHHFFEIQFLHNGKGVTNQDIETYTEHSKGLGLKSLKARALILNASINYVAATPAETGVIVSIPNPSML